MRTSHRRHERSISGWALIVASILLGGWLPSCAASKDSSLWPTWKELHEDQHVLPLVPPRPVDPGDIFLLPGDAGEDPRWPVRYLNVMRAAWTIDEPTIVPEIQTGPALFLSSTRIRSSDESFGADAMMRSAAPRGKVGSHANHVVNASVQYSGTMSQSMDLHDALQLLCSAPDSKEWVVHRSLRQSLALMSPDWVRVRVVTEVFTCTGMTVEVKMSSESGADSMLSWIDGQGGIEASRVRGDHESIEIKRRFESGLPFAVGATDIWIDVETGKVMRWTAKEKNGPGSYRMGFG